MGDTCHSAAPTCHTPGQEITGFYTRAKKGKKSDVGNVKAGGWD